MLTRRFVRVLWAALIKVLEKQPDLKRDLMPKVKKAVMAMEHQKAVSDADCSRKHEKSYQNFTPARIRCWWSAVPWNRETVARRGCC